MYGETAELCRCGLLGWSARHNGYAKYCKRAFYNGMRMCFNGPPGALGTIRDEFQLAPKLSWK